MSQTIVTVDAFTDTPFLGNPAAVCITNGPVDEGWMKAIARELNLSETAFLYPVDDGYALRWLTPAVEVDLCGHATLAAAHVLWEDGRIAPDEAARFRTRSGTLTATRSADGWIRLDFPSNPAVREASAVETEAVAAALGARPVSAWLNGSDLLADFGSQAEVLALRPDFGLLRRVEVRGVIVTAPSSMGGYDFVSRFFAPGVGIDEDPVTGSAHTFLGPFWAGRLRCNDLVGYQVSARGGVVRVGVRGDRTLLGGQAVTVLRAAIAEAAGPPGPEQS